MGYSDPDVQRRYQRERVAARRAAYLDDKSCVDCGAQERLELDHVRGEKTSHRIWSWADSRLAIELAKCDVRCRPCHQTRHVVERIRHGRARYGRGCRCEVCREAKRLDNARYQQSRRQRESNARLRLCRPSHNPSAMAPEDAKR